MVNALDIKNSLKNLIVKNNTNTSSYNVSDGLNDRVQLISGGASTRVPVLNIEYPAIFIELTGITDDHVELGNSARRNTELTVNIVGITHYGVADSGDGENIDNETIQLAQNIDYLLRNNITLSSTVDWCRVQGTEFITDEGEYNARSITNLLITKRG